MKIAKSKIKSSEEIDLRYANLGLSPKLVVTHNGNFHADDVLAVALLSLIYPELEVVRSRDPNDFDRADICVDVGGFFDPARLKFDHHQEGRAGKRTNGVYYSGFGLVWQHWGPAVCKNNLDIFSRIDRKFTQPIDARDNGQILFNEPLFEGILGFEIDDLISLYNPSQAARKNNAEAAFLESFLDALAFCRNVLSRLLKKEFELAELKQQILEDYLNLNDRRYIIDDVHRPVLAFSKEMPELLYYVFKVPDGKWNIKCAKLDYSEFDSRKPLPSSWAGKSNQELEEISGIKDMLFCHNARFICAASTKSAILKALDAALED